VTHQFLVKNFRSNFTGEIIIRKTGTPSDVACEACAISGGFIDGKARTMLFDCNSEHVEDLEKNKKAFIPDDVSDHSDKSNISKHKTKVCHHWLKGQCKKGDNCTYKHVAADEEAEKEDEGLGLLE